MHKGKCREPQYKKKEKGGKFVFLWQPLASSEYIKKNILMIKNADREPLSLFKR